MPTLFDRMRGGLRSFQMLLFGSTAIPTNPHNVASGGPVPQGLELLHTTPTVAEAEMLGQVLTQAGFDIGYVPSASTGIFGTMGNNCIYVPAEQHAEAAAFLREYLAAESSSSHPEQP